jgi:hypothetical protein
VRQVYAAAGAGGLLGGVEDLEDAEGVVDGEDGRGALSG